MAGATKNLYDAFANHISEYVQPRLAEDIVIEDLAKSVGVSKFHLNRLFQATTGFQLGEFIQRRRLQRAYSMLASGKSSVIDASLAVGYQSHSAFSRAFVKAFGCTPREVKIGTECDWKTPNTLKNSCTRDMSLQPEIVQLQARYFSGFYGAGFEGNSFVKLAGKLVSDLVNQLQQHQLMHLFDQPLGVSLESPWQGEAMDARFFVGVEHVPASLGLESYLWNEGTWARFRHIGAYESLWQTVSRIYAGWVIPEGILLKDDAVIQVYRSNPKTTPAHELCTDLYFSIQQ